MDEQTDLSSVAAPQADAPRAQDDAFIRLELRHNDLVIVPPVALRAHAPDELLRALLAPAEVARWDQHLTYDRRQRILRALPVRFSALKAALTSAARYPVTVAFDERPTLAAPLRVTLEPRPYQRAALSAWQAEGSRGVVVLPTGSGKTLLGALAIAETGLRTIVMVPTIDLLAQWRRALGEMLALPEQEIGVVGGGERTPHPITIITYESATLYPALLNRFGLLIFDECHHLPAPSYRQIALGAFSPVRLGLSATPERADREHSVLDDLIGPQVYRREPEDLARERYLAAYDVERLSAELSADERTRYDQARATYQDFVRRRHLGIRSPQDFQRKILWASARDPEARAAMMAWREARTLALCAPAKLTLLETLFARHRDERVLVFSEYNSVVAAVSQRFCLPAITHKTPAEERRLILERFRAGQYSKLVSGRVLNEGVDIPDCRIAIIVSGNATRREYIQRLGRILRPKAARAVLYELVTLATTEEHVAERRARPGEGR